MSKKKKKKGEKKTGKKDKYAHLRKRGEYKPKDDENVDKSIQQEGDRMIDKFYRFAKFGRVNKSMRPKNTKRKARL